MVRVSINFRARPDSIAAGSGVGNRVELRMTTCIQHQTPCCCSILQLREGASKVLSAFSKLVLFQNLD